MKESLPATTEKSPQTEQHATPAKNKRWIGWGLAGSMSGTISVFIAYSVLISEPYCPSCSTGLDPSYIIIFCGWILFFGVFLGFYFGQIGGFSAKIFQRKFNSPFDLSLIFALIAGAILGMGFFFTDGFGLI